PVVVTPPASCFLSLTHFPLPRSPNKHPGEPKFYQPHLHLHIEKNLQVLTYLPIMVAIHINRIGLAEEVTQYFQELKLGKKHAYVLYKISDDNRFIVVEKRVEKDAQKTPVAQYEEFVNSLPSDQCRYAIYDFTYDLPNGEGTRNKIIFFAWAPDTAKVKSKMIYASSKEALRRALTGVPTEIQGTEFSEINFDAVLEKCGAKQSNIS
ncbi:hypothetical protein C7212DRAFT_226045, partial [Tuber magnatum]